MDMILWLHRLHGEGAIASAGKEIPFGMTDARRRILGPK
jgi:hypothetical protein